MQGPAVLVVPPFYPVARAALGVSQLKANAMAAGFATRVLYLNLAFADRIGPELSEWLSIDVARHIPGEFIFSSLLFSRSEDDVRRYVEEVLAGFRPRERKAARLALRVPGRSLEQVFAELVIHAKEFVAESARRLADLQPSVVATACIFQQVCAGLTLLRGVRENDSRVVTMMGGPGCWGDPGRVLATRFADTVDFVATGEADRAFVDLLERLRAGDADPSVAGIIHTRTGHCPAPAALLSRAELDAQPHPDHSDYFEQLDQTSFGVRIGREIPLETSRGCWWGQKSHCKFCGSLGDGMVFRSKSPERAEAEMRALCERHHPDRLYIVDSIVDVRYFTTLLPSLRREPLPPTFLYTKTNLTREQVEGLSDAGVRCFYPGIESLSDSSLRAMAKGSTALINVRILRNALDFGIEASWSYLLGLVGEDDAETDRVIRWMPLVHHLSPPNRAVVVRIDRFSPYANDPDAYGLSPLTPPEPFRHVYPWGDEALMNWIPYFDSPKLKGVESGPLFTRLRDGIDAWKHARPRSYLVAIPRDDGLRIVDTRPCAVRFLWTLRGIARQVYEECENGIARAQLAEALGRPEEEVLPVLSQLIARKLVIELSGKVLSLASRPERPAPALADFASRLEHAPVSTGLRNLVALARGQAGFDGIRQAVREESSRAWARQSGRMARAVVKGAAWMIGETRQSD